MLVCFLQLVTAIAVFKHSFRSYHKGIQCNLSQLQLPFHLSGWHWCKFAIIIGRRWRARRIIWIATLILGFLGVPWCSHLLGLQWCSLLGLDWCSLFGLDRRSLVGIHWRSLLRVHWCGHAKDSEQVALQAEVYEEFIITRTVFVDKFERWLANHYLGHLLKFFDQEEGQSVVERWITTNQPSSSRFVAKSWRRTIALARPSFLEASQRQSWCWHKAFQASSTPRLPLFFGIAPNGAHVHCNVLHGDFFPVHRTAAKTSAGVGGVGHAVGRSVDSFNIPITSRLMRPF